MKIQAERINQNNELLKNDKSLLQKQVLELKKENIKNWVATEECEQYERTLCLRIDEIPKRKNQVSVCFIK